MQQVAVRAVFAVWRLLHCGRAGEMREEGEEQQGQTAGPERDVLTRGTACGMVRYSGWWCDAVELPRRRAQWWSVEV